MVELELLVENHLSSEVFRQASKNTSVSEIEELIKNMIDKN